MAYENELNQEAVVSEAPETEAETTVAEPVEAPAEVAAEEVTEAPAETTAEDLPAEAVAAADADLSDSFGEELDFDFEVEETPRVTEKISDAAQQVRNNLQDKYDEARAACKTLMDRIAYDMEQTNNNPYIRSTTTDRYEILRNSKDTEPVDVFEFQRTSGFSLRAMAITAALVATADIAAAMIFRKK